MYVEYSSNNSGGNWWLKDEDWYNLEKAGWEVQWYKDDEYYKKNSEVKRTGRNLSALASHAIKRNVSSMMEAVQEWEDITKQSSTDPGCPCCGQPHTFTFYDDEGNYKDSGPHTSYSASW